MTYDLIAGIVRILKQRVVFYQTGIETSATVELNGWRHLDALDVAFVRLDETKPIEVRPLPLGISIDTSNLRKLWEVWTCIEAVEVLWDR